MTHLLDSSAFFAFVFREDGLQSVLELLENPSLEIGLSILSASEFWARLKAEGNDAVFEQQWQIYRPLFRMVYPLDWEVTQKAIALRRASAARLPLVDSLIAATAAVHGAVLVHRDAHFRSIPGEMLRQEFIG